jgi:hypothetical protein
LLSLPTAGATRLAPSFQLVLFRPPRGIAHACPVDCSSRRLVCFELRAPPGSHRPLRSVEKQKSKQ